MQKKIKEKEIKLKYIDILDSEGTKLFNKAMRIFANIFKEDVYYIKKMRKILRRKLHPKNTIFRVLVAVHRKTNQVIGVCIYRHWTDINRSTLEYLMAKLSLRGCGIGSILYNRLKKDLRAIGSKGLFFSCAGDTDLDKYDIAEIWKNINRKRTKFYEKRGARPLKGINYNSPLYWNSPKGTYCYPNFCFDTLGKKKVTQRVRISSFLVKEIVRRVMLTYYDIPSSNKHVRRILKSIKTKKLEWRKEKYSEKITNRSF